MLGLQLLMLGITLLVLPILIGTLFRNLKPDGNRWVFSWISGQITLWAGFLAICVPMILLKKPFHQVVFLFQGYTIVLVCIAVLIMFKDYKKRKHLKQTKRVQEKKRNKKTEVFFWSVFGILLIIQLLCTILLAYEEGDDAYYLAISTYTEKSDNMYLKLPYTGAYTGLDARHGLAPFPIWIAYLAKISGIHSITVSQVLLPLVLIGMCYGIYYLMAEKLCGENKRNIPLFMIMVALLIMFGGYSLYTAENFVLVRTSQGKAVIASIIIPLILYWFMLLLEDMEKNRRSKVLLWILLVLTTATACLCSTLGTILVSLMIAVTGACIAVCYRKWQVLFPLAGCCLIPVVMAFLYFVIR